MLSRSANPLLAAYPETATSLITLGPYHPSLPEPLVIRLGAVPSDNDGPLGWGVSIREAEVETGYNHVGLEQRIKSAPLEWVEALVLVESLCGRCSQANTLAFVQAVEAAGHLIVPPRAAYLRLVLAETERITSHLLNAAETMAALDLPGREAPLRDIRERVVHAVSEWSGARLQPGLITYGGLTRNMDETASRLLMLAARNAERALRVQVTSIINGTDVASRLVSLGVVTAEDAMAGGLRGPAARASGVPADIRVSFPTGAYEDEAITIVSQRAGDAFARLVVRLLECLESFRALEQALDDLPPGPVKARGNADVRQGSGIGRVEGPRGEVFCWVQSGPVGLHGLHLSAGSFSSIGAVPGLLKGQRLEDLQLLLLSLDLCLACAER